MILLLKNINIRMGPAGNCDSELVLLRVLSSSAKLVRVSIGSFVVVALLLKFGAQIVVLVVNDGGSCKPH